MKHTSVKAKILNKVHKALRFMNARMEDYILSRNLSRAGVRNAKRIFSYTTHSELQALYQLACNCPPRSKALEIGSHLGSSTCYIAAGLAKSGGHLFCVDTWENQTMPEGERDTYSEFLRNTAGVSKSLSYLRKRSTQINESDINLPLDFVFIDADHSFEAVMADFSIVESWVSNEGVIAFHDCRAHEGVSRAIGEILSGGQWVIAGNVDNLMWITRANWSNAA